MTDSTNAVLGSLTSNIANIAKNDALKAVLPVIDNFLQGVQNNQAGTLGLTAQVAALMPNLNAALTGAGAAGIKDVAGAAQTAIDAAVNKAEATPVKTGA